MHACMQAAIHTYIHTYIHRYIETYPQIYPLHIYLHTYTPTPVHTYARTHLQTYISTSLHSYIPIRTRVHTYTHAYIELYTCWRNVRSQTSDNMDRWKSRGGKSQRGEEKKREDQRGERAKRKKMKVRKKVGKSRFTVGFHRFLAPEGPKVGSGKRRVRSHGREANFQVKSVKKWRSQTIFGRWDVERVDAVAPRSTCPSQNVQSTQTSDHFWKLTCRKSARHCGVKRISKSKV